MNSPAISQWGFREIAALLGTRLLLLRDFYNPELSPRVVSAISDDDSGAGDSPFWRGFIEDKRRAIAVLDARGMNDGPQRPAFRCRHATVPRAIAF